jgi:hypothetical protein
MTRCPCGIDLPINEPDCVVCGRGRALASTNTHRLAWALAIGAALLIAAAAILAFRLTTMLGPGRLALACAGDVS